MKIYFSILMYRHVNICSFWCDIQYKHELSNSSAFWRYLIVWSVVLLSLISGDILSCANLLFHGTKFAVSTVIIRHVLCCIADHNSIDYLLSTHHPVSPSIDSRWRHIRSSCRFQCRESYNHAIYYVLLMTLLMCIRFSILVTLERRKQK